MAISLKSIADDLKLSKATVSWILSGQGEAKGFSEKTIKRVIEYANQIGYTPNLLAKSLSTGYTKIIGLIIPYISDQFYSCLAQAIERQLTEKGFLLILGSSEGNELKERELIKTFRSMRTAGLIIAPTNRSSETLSSMKNDNYPFVLIDRFEPDVDSSYVITNNEDSSYQLVREMYRKGCKQIAFVTTDTHLYVMGKRLAGYEKAVKESLQKHSCCLEIERDNYIQDLNHKLDCFLETHKQTDGFFFATHYLAEETIRYFFQKGIDYRNLFKFSSIGTTKTLDIMVPEMTRAIMPVHNMGTEAVNILIEKILHPKQMQEVKLILENTISDGGKE